ncbi:orotate phosphoribosyltransferase [Natronocella acetinitrilica]|uniref:Orotate phosphoribosyltransferase n=1 Tax=Natronocella acetinitrilica TaxID=414046 RepID=A0AAE3G0J4_9GAMM|nr:orotate phosphoribosyltransferase [Natronocella acetinitrilica]MCP1673112.1 orotate phosphoribosyltransferase [Natronocella acetinitrilica]
MHAYKYDFLRFALKRNVLRFGEFTLKSGRISPYFFNAGLFNTGASVAALGRYYAQSISTSGIGFDMLYGPAYKGIPLATATAIALSDEHHRDIPFAFNRKEAKDHGEGGVIVGAPLQGRVLIIDDVISAGTSVRESVDLIHGAGASLAGVAIALDRKERGSGNSSAVQQVESELGVPVIPIADLEDLIAWLEEMGDYQQELEAIRDYRGRYGA